MSRSELANYIRKAAEDELLPAAWEAIMVNHYEDIETEAARAAVVRLFQNKNFCSPDEFKKRLQGIADSLELPVNENTFYYRGGGAGVLQTPILAPGANTVVYEPLRSGSHYDLCRAVESGEQPICEYMKQGLRQSFRVTKSPEYGRLTIHV
ncbi:hypothetical protein [Prosthecobacter vanneervenii]|uniref:Uncharacterized protein n=1 Tax=Prosthecobacter vanneervenii TaxID=48466 RepID=A0A7W7Y743_9BACT|nr:hypothetical protein [Prosthecobacter vanneervenii]MBB5030849.1 hypothetical protein [Prosthecobacter vanneervenii]